jgi:hypothetical protein
VRIYSLFNRAATVREWFFPSAFTKRFGLSVSLIEGRMKVVLRDPPLFIVLAAILMDLRVSRVRSQPAAQATAKPEPDAWPRQFLGSIPPRIDPA